MIILQCVYNGDVRENLHNKLQPNITSEAIVTQKESGYWHLEIPPGPAGQYRLAQLDDYCRLPRSAFQWHPPVTLELRARASAQNLPGTWGFGLWNDPFSLSLGFGGGMRRFPSLPNALWFFFASPQNHLTLNDNLPANGQLAAAFSSPNIPSTLLAFISPLVPLMAFTATARWLRRIARRWIIQDSAQLIVNVVDWHDYKLTWNHDGISFELDGKNVLESKVTPQGPLGFLVWIDNQFAALPPSGKFSYGTMENEEPAWIEIIDLEIKHL